MDFEAFKALLQDDNADSQLHGVQLALWKAGRGDWDGAHDLVQDGDGQNDAWIHAYLHRAEGDLGNASYWYRRAGKPVAHGSLEDEWENIVRVLLA
ncbi:MAG: hypothetical protein AB8G77_08160 [Rhodothermales bacterium]